MSNKLDIDTLNNASAPQEKKQQPLSPNDLKVGEVEEKSNAKTPMELESGGSSEDEEKYYQESENVFADNGEGPDFRGVSRWGAAVLIAKGQIGLGVLGVPGTFEALGFVPGVLCLCILCAMVTWMAYVVGQFRINHPRVHSVGDAAYLMFGPVGRELIGTAMSLYYTLSYGSGLITLSVAVNAWSNHAACTMAWIGMWAGIIIILACTIRTMKVLQWGGYVALVSIFIGIWIVGIACLAQSHPAMAPPGASSGVKVAGTGSSYVKIAVAVATQLFSLGGTGSFFTIHAEMKNQKEYLPAVLMGQGFIVVNYIALACVLYGKVGNYIASPALGSAGPLIMKIANGVALPALIFSTLFQAHIPIKYLFVRILRGTKHLQSNSMIHWGTWVGMAILVCAVGLIVAGAIPFFDDLLGLAGALLGTSFTLITPGFMTLYELSNSHRPNGDGSRNPFVWMRECARTWRMSRRNGFIAAGAWIIIAVGFYITVSGVYGTISDILDEYATGRVGSVFSCADNSKL